MSMNAADSSVKMKKVKKETGFRLRKCIIHTVGSAKDDTLSAFTE